MRNVELNNNYTNSAELRCYELADREMDAVWEELDRSPDDLPTDLWLKKMQSISNEYLTSSRFALMRIVCSQTQPSANGSFSIFLDGEKLSFSAVTIEHAKEIHEKPYRKELANYEKLLMNKAKEHALANGETIDVLGSIVLIRKALSSKSMNACNDLLKKEAQENIESKNDAAFDCEKYIRERTNEIKAELNSRLSRADAMHLGHLLDFTLDQMQWFLLRVFDYDDGFRFNSSDDLIDAYGFLTHASPKKINALKAQYSNLAKDIPALPLDQKPEDWTVEIVESLPEKCRTWSPDNRDEMFLAWLTEKTPYLNQVSRTALTIYRNLVAAAVYPDSWDEETGYDLVGVVLNLTNGEESETVHKKLYTKNELSKKKCIELAARMLKDNQNTSQTKQADHSRAYRIVTVNSKKQLSIASGINSSRERVNDLLLGNEPVQKSDVLHVLWLLATFCWETVNELPNTTCTKRIKELVNAASICLDSANLPPFYFPHLMEQSMILATIHAGVEEDPSVVYETICSSVIVERKSKRKEEAEHC